MYLFLADLVLTIHLGFVVFVLCGGILVLKWRWVAWLHLPAVAWGTVVEFTGWICPLTPLENWLRSQGGETTYRSDFIAQYLLAGALPGGPDARPSVAVRHSGSRPQFRDLLVALANACVWCFSESIGFSRAGECDCLLPSHISRFTFHVSRCKIVWVSATQDWAPPLGIGPVQVTLLSPAYYEEPGKNGVDELAMQLIHGQACIHSFACEDAMPIDEITQKVSDRYARAASTGEQMCCPTSYDMADLKSFIPEEVLKISYGCGTPAGLKTVSQGETVLDIGSGGGIDCFEASRLVGPYWPRHWNRHD